MKRLLTMFLGIAVFLICSADAQSEGITVLSQQYHIKGYCQGDYYFPPEDSYDVTGNLPMSRDVWGGNTKWGYECWTNAYSNVDLFEASAKATGYEFGDYSAEAMAYAAWTFSPVTSDLTMQVSGWSSNASPYWVLTDLTNGNVLISEGFNNYPDSYHPYSWDSKYTQYEGLEPPIVFDVTHQYSVWVTMPYSEFDGGTDSYWNATFTPEPATLMLLGLGAVMLRRIRS